MAEQPRNRRLVLIAVLTGQFATAFPITILSVIIAPIARSYGVSATVLTWAITGPFLVMAVATPVFGKLGDTYGHRKLFLIGLAGSAAGALATAAAPTAATLIAFRIIAQGFGAAAQPTSLALIMRVYPADQRLKATGWWSMVAASSLVTGLVIGGPLAQALGWRALFVVQAGITAASLLMALLILPRDHDTQQDAGRSHRRRPAHGRDRGRLVRDQSVALQRAVGTAWRGLHSGPCRPRAIRPAPVADNSSPYPDVVLPESHLQPHECHSLRHHVWLFRWLPPNAHIS